MTIETTADRIERVECEQLRRATSGELQEMLADAYEAGRTQGLALGQDEALTAYEAGKVAGLAIGHRKECQRAVKEYWRGYEAAERAEATEAAVQEALDAMTTQLPHATSQEADEPQQRDGQNLFRILIDTLEVLETVKDRQQYLENVLHVLNRTAPGSDARAYGVSRVSLEAIVV